MGPSGKLSNSVYRTDLLIFTNSQQGYFSVALNM